MRRSSVEPGRQISWKGRVYTIESVRQEGSRTWVKLVGYPAEYDIGVATQWELVRVEQETAWKRTGPRPQQRKRR